MAILFLLLSISYPIVMDCLAVPAYGTVEKLQYEMFSKPVIPYRTYVGMCRQKNKTWQSKSTVANQVSKYSSSKTLLNYITEPRDAFWQLLYSVELQWCRMINSQSVYHNVFLLSSSGPYFLSSLPSTSTTILSISLACLCHSFCAILVSLLKSSSFGFL